MLQGACALCDSMLQNRPTSYSVQGQLNADLADKVQIHHDSIYYQALFQEVDGQPHSYTIACC